MSPGGLLAAFRLRESPGRTMGDRLYQSAKCQGFYIVRLMFSLHAADFGEWYEVHADRLLGPGRHLCTTR